MTKYITDNPADTMRLACLGPRWSREYDAAAAAGDYATLDRLDADQAAGEADYARRWAESVRAIAAERGYHDVTVVVSDDDADLMTSTSTDEDADGRPVELVIWQAAHDATALPEGW